MTVGEWKKLFDGQPDDREVDFFIGGVGATVQLSEEMGTNLDLEGVLPDGYIVTTVPSNGN
jgi:hypothetical protein